MTVTENRPNTVLGTRLLRREDPALLTGEAKYCNDLNLPGALHLALVRSPYAHARIRSVDLTAARAAAGVVAAYSGADLTDLWAAPMPSAWAVTADMKNPAHYPLATGKACYVGDGVACVLATSETAARDALDLIDVDYEPLPAVVDLEDALSDRVVIHDDLGTNKSYQWDLKIEGTEGQVAQAFADAGSMTNNTAAAALAQKVAEFILPQAPGEVIKFATGWTDDMFMATSVLSREAARTGDARYAAAAGRLLTTYAARLQRGDGLFIHAGEGPHTWGRGNGFAAFGLTDALTYLPPTWAERPRVLLVGLAPRHVKQVLVAHAPGIGKVNLAGQERRVVEHSAALLLEETAMIVEIGVSTHHERRVVAAVLGAGVGGLLALHDARGQDVPHGLAQQPLAAAVTHLGARLAGEGAAVHLEVELAAPHGYRRTGGHLQFHLSEELGGGSHLQPGSTIEVLEAACSFDHLAGGAAATVAMAERHQRPVAPAVVLEVALAVQHLFA